MKRQNRHKAPKSFNIPKDARPDGLVRLQKVQQLQQALQQAQNDLQTYAVGISRGMGIDVVKGDWHVTDDFSEIRAGKPPEPKVIRIEDLLKAAGGNRAQRRAKKEAKRA